MSTGNENLDLLIKLLGMTRSANDAEALVAVRKANDQVAKFKTTWEDLLKGRVKVVADPFASVAQPPQHKSSAPPPASAAGLHRPPPPRAKSQPPVQFYWIDIPSGYVGPFSTQADAQSYRSRLSMGNNAILAMNTPNRYQTPLQFGINLNRQRARQAKPAAQPQPNLNTGFGQRQPNRFAGKCWSCNRSVAAGDGFLATQDTTGKWRIECGDNKGHNAPYSQRTKRPVATAEDLKDLL